MGHGTDAGVHPDPRKTEAIVEMKEPTNVSKLRSFLGMVNQLEKFIHWLVNVEKDKLFFNLLLKKNCWVWDVDKVIVHLYTEESIVLSTCTGHECTKQRNQSVS